MALLILHYSVVTKLDNMSRMYDCLDFPLRDMKKNHEAHKFLVNVLISLHV